MLLQNLPKLRTHLGDSPKLKIHITVSNSSTLVSSDDIQHKKLDFSVLSFSSPTH